jgi:predicted MFS family arabinose efflux permease
MDAMGAMLGPILAFVLLAFVPGAFDVVFVSSFFVGLIGLAILLLFVENRPVAVDSARGAAGDPNLSVVELFKNPRFRHLAVCALVLSLMTMSDAFVYLVLQRQLNLAVGAFPLLYVLTSLGYLVLAIPAGHLADRVGRFRVFAAGYGALVVLYAVLVWVPASLTVLFVSVLLLSAYYAATEGVLMALGSAVLSPDCRTTGLAVLATATAVSRFGASLIFGWAWMRLGLKPAVSIFLAGLVVSIAVTVATAPSAELDRA